MAKSLKTDIYDLLTTSVNTGSIESRTLETLSIEEVKKLIGKEADGLTNTFVGNIQRRLIKKMDQAAAQLIADWIISSVQVQFANAEIEIKRGNIVKIWLDGKPTEEK